MRSPARLSENEVRGERLDDRVLLVDRTTCCLLLNVQSSNCALTNNEVGKRKEPRKKPAGKMARAYSSAG